MALETWTHLEVFKEHYARSLDVRGEVRPEPGTSAGQL